MTLVTHEWCTCNFTEKSLVDACPICMQRDDDAAYVLTCGHLFHADCIKQWLCKVPSCPLCRQEEQLCSTCNISTDKSCSFPISESDIPSMFALSEFLELIKVQDLSDVLRRGFCDFGYLYGVTRETYLLVMALFSKYQTLDDDFIEDYYGDLDIHEIYNRRDELLLSPDLVNDMQKDLGIV